jgi:hypothetical protein
MRGEKSTGRAFAIVILLALGSSEMRGGSRSDLKNHGAKDFLRLNLHPSGLFCS